MEQLLPQTSALTKPAWFELSQLTCSAAPGSLFKIASAALLFLYVMAQAKGVIPCLSRTFSLISGCEIIS